MDSFHRSRVRIVFEVLCAFGTSASLVAAWQQTYASAFLPAAAIAGLYGIVHAFDLIRRRTPAKVEAQASEPAPVDAGETVIRSWPLTAASVDQAPEPLAAAPAKAPRKKRKAAKAEAPKVVELVPEPEAEQQDLAAQAEYAPIAPLFEPEPFVRTQRAAFGRKAG